MMVGLETMRSGTLPAGRQSAVAGARAARDLFHRAGLLSALAVDGETARLLQRNSAALVAALLLPAALDASAIGHALLAVALLTLASRLVLSPLSSLPVADPVLRVVGTGSSAILLLLLPFAAGLALGRGFLVIAVLIVALDLLRTRLTRHPLVDALLTGLSCALALEAGAVAVGADTPLQLATVVALIGTMLALAALPQPARSGVSSSAGSASAGKGDRTIGVACGCAALLATSLTLGMLGAAGAGSHPLAQLIASLAALASAGRAVWLVDGGHGQRLAEDRSLAALVALLLVTLAL